MSVQTVFARHEIKYIISTAARARIESQLSDYMYPDEYGRSLVSSVYYDTPDYLLIRRSLDSPLYKEKLRLRGYGSVDDSSTVYAEIKKKYDSVVYKRRYGMTMRAALEYLADGWRAGQPPDDQIGRELHFILLRYANLQPSAYVSCERQAYYAVDDHEFRVTFDENIKGRITELLPGADNHGCIDLLDSRFVLMEVKSGSAIPLWFCRILSEERLYKSSFSKYGSVYQKLIMPASHSGKPIYCGNRAFLNVSVDMTGNSMKNIIIS